jgi:F-type H+-transporting ATPase subunit b
LEHFDWLRGFVFPYINFSLFMVLVYVFARPAINKALAEKKQAFEKLLGEAQKTRELAEEQQKAINARLAGLSSEIDAIVAQARKAAELESLTILQQAEQIAQHMRSEAKNAAKAELDAARAAIEVEILRSVTSKVQERIKKDVSTAKHAELIEQQFRVVSSSKLGG